MSERFEKQVEWAYPTSANAKLFGYGKTGCWVVQTQEGLNPPVAISGHEHECDAVDAARALVGNWTSSYLQIKGKQYLDNMPKQIKPKPRKPCTESSSYWDQR